MRWGAPRSRMPSHSPEVSTCPLRMITFGVDYLGLLPRTTTPPRPDEIPFSPFYWYVKIVDAGCCR